MNLIEVKNLVKTYGQIRAVDGISFAVKEGEIFGLLGPNGAGKTTTLEILEGLKKEDGGEINVPPLEDLGIVLQTTGFFPELSLLELLKLFASFYKKYEYSQQVIERFELESILEKKYAEVSQGQRQRFALAVALLHQPKLLILDEPTAGLDPAVRQRFWEIILELQHDGLAVLLTTHYMEEAEIVCDRTAIIDNGKILACERPIKLINSLGVMSRISFMSSKPINLEVLEKFYGVLGVRRERYVYELETELPEKTLRELLDWEKEFKGKIFNLRVQQATLDDVFLKLTGHHLRE